MTSEILPFSVASIGECMIELSQREDGEGWKLGFAGDTFNMLWMMRALLPAEARTDYVSAFGDDPFSQDQRDFFAKAGITTASSPVIAGGRPGLYAITLDGAERSFTYWRGEAAARKVADDPAALSKSLSGQSLVFFSGITLAILEPAARATLIAAIGEARRNGSTTAFDPNYRARLWSDAATAKAAIDQAFAVTDIALPTYPDEQAMCGDASKEATAERLLAAGVKEVVVKDGEHPCLVVANGQSTEVAAERVKAVDTTGAGDSFNGGYLAARLLGHEPAEAARRAHKVAAAVVQVRGALADPAPLRDVFAKA